MRWRPSTRCRRTPRSSNFEQVPTSRASAVLADGRKVWDEVLTVTDGRAPTRPDEVAVVASASFPVLQPDGSWARTSAHVGDTIHLTWLAQAVVGTIALNGPAPEDLGVTGVVDPAARSTISPLAAGTNVDTGHRRSVGDVGAWHCPSAWSSATMGGPPRTLTTMTHFPTDSGCRWCPNWSADGCTEPDIGATRGWYGPTALGRLDSPVRQAWPFWSVLAWSWRRRWLSRCLTAETKVSSSAARIETWFDRPSTRATMFVALAAAVAGGGRCGRDLDVGSWSPVSVSLVSGHAMNARSGVGRGWRPTYSCCASAHGFASSRRMTLTTAGRERTTPTASSRKSLSPTISGKSGKIVSDRQ